MLEKTILVSVVRNGAALSALVLVGVLGDQRVRKPADLLGGGLLPLAPLAGNLASSVDA